MDAREGERERENWTWERGRERDGMDFGAYVETGRRPIFDWSKLAIGQRIGVFLSIRSRTEVT